MGDELPILKGILNGVVKYHNARMYIFLREVIELFSPLPVEQLCI